MDKLEIVEKSLNLLSEELKAIRESVSAGFVKVNANFTVISNRLISLEKQVRELNFKVDNLDGSTSKGLSEVGNKIESLTDEISKISAVTKYDEEFKNLQGFN
jgi:hypothetical protein